MAKAQPHSTGPQIVIEDGGAKPGTGQLIDVPASWTNADGITTHPRMFTHEGRDYERVGKDDEGRDVYRFQDWR